MIASLRGRMAARGENFLIVEVGGVGFQVYVPSPLLELITPGQEVRLFTHLHVRENELALYGFETEEELGLFNLLLGVNGVGPRTALTVLSTLPADQFRSAVARGEVETLQRIPGIGKKTAERIILDLRDKVAKEGFVPVPTLSPEDQEAIIALTSLGYTASEAREALASLPREKMAVEEKVLLALRHLGGE